MATISSVFSSPNLLHHPSKPNTASPKLTLHILKATPFQGCSYPKLTFRGNSQRLYAVAEEVAAADPNSKAARRVYIGNIPRTVDNAELTKIVEEHGAVEKAEVMYDKYSGRSRRFAFVTAMTVEDANTIVEKLNGTEIGGREIKVNITEKPLIQPDLTLVQAEETQFVDSPHKVYVGNLSKGVTTESLQKLFSEKANVLSAKVSRVPGTSKTSGFGFVSFSSEEDVEAVISSFNNTLFEGQKIRVNKA